MDFKQSTIQDLLDSEREMVMSGAKRFGAFYVNAAEFNVLLNHFIKSVDPDRFIAAMFLSEVKKHHALALFSIVRLHHTQAMMDLRQVLEAGAWAAYAIANPEEEKFAKTDEKGFLKIPSSLEKKRNKWLDKNFSQGSQTILNIKRNVNKSTHSNIVYAHVGFKPDFKNYIFETPFFDFEDKYLVKSNLWMVANIAMGLMDLFYGVNKGLNVIKFIDDFIPRLKSLEKKNIELKEKMMKSKRFLRIQKISGEQIDQNNTDL